MNDEKYSCHDVHRDVLYVLVLAEFCMEVFDGEFQHITEWMYLNGTRVSAQLPIKLHVESATNVVAQVNTKQLADRNREHRTSIRPSVIYLLILTISTVCENISVQTF
nr:uncharacterized protein LOC131787783 isoform X1 [Pocillopora verrucosa]